MAGEVRAGLGAGADRVCPLLIDALHPRIFDRRWVGHQLIVLLLVREVRILAVRAGDERPLVADPELAAGVERPGAIEGPVVRLGRHDADILQRWFGENAGNRIAPHNILDRFQIIEINDVNGTLRTFGDAG